MKSLYQHIVEAPSVEWNYYEGIGLLDEISNPFEGTLSYNDFILKFFRRGGKVRIFENCGIEIKDLNRPNHICSVFFLGVLMYYRTGLHKKYKTSNNDPGYRSFPFIWFLIALFHDNAYEMEGENKLKMIQTLDDLKHHFNIRKFLFDLSSSRCAELMNAREHYFRYRKEVMRKVDHGLLGGILLYDRLYEIREQKKREHEDDLFWGKKLVRQYKLAADAISLHNMFRPSKDREEVYREYGLGNLIGLPPTSFKEFPLFYILGVVDTLEPLKKYSEAGFDDKYILENILVNFGDNGFAMSNKPGSELDFQQVIKNAKDLKTWLDVEVKADSDRFEIIFK